MDTNNWTHGELLATSGNYWKTCTLHAGVKLDLFTMIGDKKLSSNQISKKLKVDNRATTMLLNALTAMNLLEKSSDKYLNTTPSKSFLSKESPQYIGYIIMHHHHLVDSWSQLDKAVKTGKPVRKKISFDNAKIRESFLMGMYNIASNLAPMLVTKFDLSKKRHFIDLGGGPGTYAIHFCLNNPNLKATVYDLPKTKPFAIKTIEKYNLKDRIEFIEGNFLENDIDGNYDVAWLSHILHGEGPKDCQKIIKKVASVLEPGGMMIIHDFILDNTMDAPVFPALFSLNMLLGTPSGQSYSEKQIFEMLKTGGFQKIKRIPFENPGGSGLIAGVMK